MSIILDGTSGINTPNTFAYKNLLIDAGFTINQRTYVSAATLASGVYGHDRWKAGASGGDYSFTQLASNTQITIASGKSLIQVVEDKNVSGTSYVLSWTGTAQARYAVNSATPLGSYAASPIVITGQTAGTTMSVEFNTGTLSKPQLELGAVATSFDQRAYSQELAMCQRYYYRLTLTDAIGVGLFGVVNASGTNTGYMTLDFPVTMRDTPSSLEQSGTASHYRIGTTACSSVPILVFTGINFSTTQFIIGTASLTIGVVYGAKNGAVGAYFGWSAEL